MKKTLTSLCAVVPMMATLAAVVLLAGCDTFNSRAKEKSEVYDNLSPKTQKRLQRGTIHVGDTEDMVYIALGEPEEKREMTNTKGSENIWIYRTYWQQYEGTEWVGWRRSIEPAPGGFAVFHEPVSRDIYATRVDDVIRVTFANSKVVSVNQQKR
jgi:outer membrane protein assembly factor BamE (lipoprotein component of BamABCDE complex)